MLGTAVEVTPPILAALEDYFGRPYPYAKLDLIAVPEFWPGAMENAGLVTFADRVLLKEPGSLSAEQLRSLVRVNAHELAHMWFGDLVTMAWWDDLWLNESFADWLAYRVTDDLYPDLEADLSQLRGVQGIFGVDARPTTEAIRQPITHAGDAVRNVGLAYAKGRAVLGMVERWVEQAFVPDELAPAFAAYVRLTLDPALERFGLEPRPGEAESVALFRPRLLAWLGDEGDHPEVVAYARRLAAAYLADPASVDPALAGLALGLAAKDGDLDRFETYRRRFEESESPLHRARFLAALGAFDDPAAQARALDYTLEGPLRPTELFTIPGGLADSPGGGDRLFEWFLTHYDAFAERMPPEFVAFMPGMAAGCSAERLERAREFFSQPEHRVEGTDVQMAKTAEQVMDCVGLRQREGDAVAAYLRSLDGGGAT